MNDPSRNAVDVSERAIAVKMRIDGDQPVEGIGQNLATSREVTASPSLKRSCRMYARYSEPG
jgi:hypothetical protein